MIYNAHDYAPELKAAVDAAREAGRHIAERAGSLADLHVRKKGLNDLVTEVDEAAQRIIIGRLEEGFPTYDVLAEEGEASAADVHAAGHRWIIDPIDGTTNFTHGVPPYAVSIGLQNEDEIVVAVVLDVSRNELFTAVRGNGMRVNDTPTKVSTTERLSEGLITTGFPYRTVGHLEVYLQVLGDFMTRSRGIRRPGSAAVDLAYVAAGRFDGFFETGLMSWDVAAGMLLVEEAGGRATDYRNRKNRIFEEQMLASNGTIHLEMLELLEPMRDVYL